MKKSILTLIAFALFVLANFAGAQTLNDVLDKHFKAVGQEKQNNIKSLYIKGKISQMGMDLPLEMRMKKPDLFIISVDMQGQKMIQAYDGEKGWMIAPWMSPDPQPLEGEQLAQARQQTSLESELFDLEKKGNSAELMGKVNIEGKDYYRIKLTSSDGKTKDYFIDAQTFYISKVKAKINAQGQTVDVEQILSDYKEIDGIMMPMKIESKSPMGTNSVVMEEVKFNENIDNSVFKQPTK